MLHTHTHTHMNTECMMHLCPTASLGSLILWSVVDIYRKAYAEVAHAEVDGEQATLISSLTLIFIPKID